VFAVSSEAPGLAQREPMITESVLNAPVHRPPSLRRSASEPTMSPPVRSGPPSVQDDSDEGTPALFAIRLSSFLTLSSH
jgi:hypothetical protein